jgi:predicted patatin/cPLA2 family phospholipase
VTAPARTAFVFAGGSSLGAVQVGMLKALIANGWTTDFVVGSSVGAINAAYFASPDTGGRRGSKRSGAAYGAPTFFRSHDCAVCLRCWRGADTS